MVICDFYMVCINGYARPIKCRDIIIEKALKDSPRWNGLENSKGASFSIFPQARLTDINPYSDELFDLSIDGKKHKVIVSEKYRREIIRIVKEFILKSPQKRILMKIWLDEMISVSTKETIPFDTFVELISTDNLLFGTVYEVFQ